MAGVEILLSALCLQNATCVSATTMPVVQQNTMYDSMQSVDSNAIYDARGKEDSVYLIFNFNVLMDFLSKKRTM